MNGNPLTAENIIRKELADAVLQYTKARNDLTRLHHEVDSKGLEISIHEAQVDGLKEALRLIGAEVPQ